MIPIESQTDGAPAVEWSPLERFGFRFAFVYFAMFGAASLLDVGAGPRALSARLIGPPVQLFARVLFGLTSTTATAADRRLWAVAQQLAAFAIAAAVAIGWSLVAKRTEYVRLRGWSLTILRYYVAIIMMVYGGFKIINSQFPPLSLEQLSQPLGSNAPMGLLWEFMGYSAVYAAFTGLGEAVGAFLLFFRRTTTAGALILVAVLSNVALLNYVFDVPVKQLSSNLLFACVLIAATDARRIVDVLFLNRTAVPVDQSFDFRWRWIYSIRRVLKPVVVTAATLGPVTASFFVHRRIVERPPLYGLYEVDRFARNGVEVAPLTTDGVRWRQVVFSRPGTMSVRLTNDTVRVYSATVDTIERSLAIRGRAAPEDARVFTYEWRAPSGLHLLDTATGDSLDITLRPLDPLRAFPLLRY
jgi:hypothetical protein